MRHLKHTVVNLLLISLLVACRKDHRNLPGYVQHALAAAGNNKENLLQVIDNYQSPQDSLKLKAAYFLIGNMEGHYHFEGSMIQTLATTTTKIDSLLSARQNTFKRLNDSGKLANPIYDTLEPYRKYKRKVLDSLQKIKGAWDLSATTRIEDIRQISPDLLIENIDMAFVAWNYPWCKKLTFEQFCEYILPYKVMNEAPTSWRKLLMERFAHIKTKMKDSTDAREACLLINDELKRDFYLEGTYFRYPLDLSFAELDKLRMGKCSDANHYAAYAMRAMGVPVMNDYTTLWANKNKGHDWLVLLYKFNNQSFVGGESDPGLDKILYAGRRDLKRKMAKVFRHTYAAQKSGFDFSQEFENVPDIFKDLHYTDVTNQYIATSDVSVKLDKKITDDEINFTYLCIFSNNKWNPVACSKINNAQVSFPNIGRGITYLIGTYKDGELVPLAPPLVVSDAGGIIYLNHSGKADLTAKLSAKYPQDNSNKIVPGQHYELFYWNDKWISMGTQVPAVNYLVYNNMNNQTLYILRNKDKGEQERIFTIENGQQKWW